MTVSYSQQISTTSFCLFSRLLISRWKGSVFKLIWRDLILFLILYGSCAAVYRCTLTDPQKRTFEKVAMVCESFRNGAPISFILGFYVAIVVSRWWEQYMLIPWPDDICILAASLIQGEDTRSLTLRKNFVRYINLAFVLTFSRISAPVARDFPTYDHLIEKEYLTPKEKSIMEMVDEMNHHQEVWDPLPLVWASLVVVKARKEGCVPDDHSQEAIIHEIINLRYKCSKLQEYHNVSVPLVYTQVATMATYSYFFCSIVARQFLDPEQGYKGHLVDYYVPIFTILQFIFYMGWLKVAESLLNPFGQDDDDFDTIELLERHFEVSNLLVDDVLKMKPHLLQDLEQKAPRNMSSNNNTTFISPTDTYPPVFGPPSSTRASQKSFRSRKRPSSFDNGTSIVEINPVDQIATHSSRESFCSIATAIPNTNRRKRSRSLTSSSVSSTDRSYESCFSLFTQPTNKNETILPTIQQKGLLEAHEATSYEKVCFSTCL